MDEKALLEAIRAIVQEENKPISARLDTLEQNQRTIQDDLSSLKSDVAHMNHHIEPKLDKVLEMVSNANDRNRQLDVVTGKVEDHEHRLFAVEETLRKAE